MRTGAFDIMCLLTKSCVLGVLCELSYLEVCKFSLIVNGLLKISLVNFSYDCSTIISALNHILVEV